MISLVGWISGVLLALCALPLAYRSHRDKKCDIDGMFLWMWFLGEVFGLFYVGSLQKLPLIANYSVNVLAILVVMWYKYRGRGE